MYFFNCLYANELICDDEFERLAKISIDYAITRLGASVDDWDNIPLDKIDNNLTLAKSLVGGGN